MFCGPEPVVTLFQPSCVYNDLSTCMPQVYNVDMAISFRALFNYSNRIYTTLIKHTVVLKRTVMHTVWIIETSDNQKIIADLL